MGAPPSRGRTHVPVRRLSFFALHRRPDSIEDYRLPTACHTERRSDVPDVAIERPWHISAWGNRSKMRPGPNAFLAAWPTGQHEDGDPSRPHSAWSASKSLKSRFLFSRKK